MVAPGGWRIEIDVPVAGVGVFDRALGPFADAISVVDIAGNHSGVAPMWRYEAFCVAPPDPGELALALELAAALAGVEMPEPRVSTIPPVDWVAETQKRFPPIRAGRFFLQPSHHDGPRPGGSWPIRVDAAAAFGTGEHGTTRGCLLALDALRRRGRLGTVLDMGSGSGVLAMAAARAGARRVLAVEVDPGSVAVARTNVRRNGLSARVRVIRNDGYRGPVLARAGRMDLILANILARPLIAMAPTLKRRLRPGGHAVLSGLLWHQERAVLAAHVAQGLRLVGRRTLDGWTTLLVRRPAR